VPLGLVRGLESKSIRFRWSWWGFAGSGVLQKALLSMDLIWQSYSLVIAPTT